MFDNLRRTIIEGIDIETRRVSESIQLNPFDDTDWMAYSGAEEGEGQPALIASGVPLVNFPFTEEDKKEMGDDINQGDVIVDQNGISVVFYSGSDLPAAHKETNYREAKKIAASLKSPIDFIKLRADGWTLEGFSEEIKPDVTERKINESDKDSSNKGASQKDSFVKFIQATIENETGGLLDEALHTIFNKARELGVNDDDLKNAVKEYFDNKIDNDLDYLIDTMNEGKVPANDDTAEEKIKKLTEGGKVSEKLDREVFDRLEGLINQDELDKFKELVLSLATDLVREGFDEPDIAEYLSNHLTVQVEMAAKEIENNQDTETENSDREENTSESKGIKFKFVIKEGNETKTAEVIAESRTSAIKKIREGKTNIKIIAIKKMV